MSNSHRYDDWSKERLVAHIQKLENLVRNTRSAHPTAFGNNVDNDITVYGSSSSAASSSKTRPFRFSDYPTRKIALKFTYDGSHYNGLEHQRDVTPLPTVEETLWEALVRTRLVDPDGDFDSCGWEKCGRTDRGVSSAGQVVSFWIRCKEWGHPQRESIQRTHVDDAVTSSSSIPSSLPEEAHDSALTEVTDLDDSLAAMSGWDEEPTDNRLPDPNHYSTPSPPVKEYDYVSLLNGVLPETLRVLSWAAVAPTFSARFNCQARHYKYFFVSRELDIDAMREGASRLVGEHDWRNLCKVDPAKFRLDAEGDERWSFRRLVKRAEINRVASASQSVEGLGSDLGEMWVFDLVGTAFLYNQVRHIMAILLLIGTGLEEPSIVTALLNVDPSKSYSPFKEGDPIPAVVTSKPIYQMADALPLVLWDCYYDESYVKWSSDRNTSASAARPSDAYEVKDSSINGIYAHLRSIHERSWLHTTMHMHFLEAAARFHRPPPQYLPLSSPTSRVQVAQISDNAMLAIPLGGGTSRNTRYAGAKGYVKLLDRKRLDDMDAIYERYKNGKGAKMRREKKVATVVVPS